MLHEHLDRDPAVLGPHAAREIGEDLRERGVPAQPAFIDQGRDQRRGHGLRVGADVKAIVPARPLGTPGAACADHAERAEAVAAHDRAGQGGHAIARADGFEQAVETQHAGWEGVVDRGSPAAARRGARREGGIDARADRVREDPGDEHRAQHEQDRHGTRRAGTRSVRAPAPRFGGHGARAYHDYGSSRGRGSHRVTCRARKCGNPAGNEPRPHLPTDVRVPSAVNGSDRARV